MDKAVGAESGGDGRLHLLAGAVVGEDRLTDVGGAPTVSRQGIIPLHRKISALFKSGHTPGIGELEVLAVAACGDWSRAGSGWIQVAGPLQKIVQAVLIIVEIIRRITGIPRVTEVKSSPGFMGSIGLQD